MLDRYQRFDLEIRDAQSTHQVLARSSDGCQAERALPAERLDALRQRAAQMPTSAGEEGKELGRALYAEVLSGSTGELWRRTDTAKADRGETTREIRICLPADSTLHDLPWELLRDDSGYLATQPDVVLSRTVPRTGALRQPAAQGRLRVLLTSGFAAHEGARLRAEEVQVRRALSNLADIRTHAQVTAGALGDLFEAAPHIWHHIGHGALARGGDDREHRVSVQDPHPLRSATGEDLAEQLGRQHSLQLAVVSTCHAASRVGLATCLARIEVPLVVGFVGLLSDRAAEIFAKTFYEHLTRVTVGHAIAASRRALANDVGLTALEWSQVVYYASAENIRLIHPPGTAAEVPREVSGDRPHIHFGDPGGAALWIDQVSAENAAVATHMGNVTFNSTRQHK